MLIVLFVLVVETEKVMSNTNSPSGFKALAFNRAKLVQKGWQNPARFNESKLLVPKDRKKNDYMDDSRISNGGDVSGMEASPAIKDEKKGTYQLRGQNIENLIAAYRQSNDITNDSYFNPIATSAISIRALIHKSREEDAEESMFKRTNVHYVANQSEGGVPKDRILKNQKMVSPILNRKSQTLKKSTLAEGTRAENNENGINAYKPVAEGIRAATEADDPSSNSPEKLHVPSTIVVQERSLERRAKSRNHPRHRINTLAAQTNANQANLNDKPPSNRQSNSVKDPPEKEREPEKNANQQKFAPSKNNASGATRNVYRTITNIAKTSDKNGNRGSQQYSNKPPDENARYYSYLNYLYKVSFTFAVVSRPPVNATTYKYFIGKGNNGLMVRTLLKTRWWWTATDSAETAEVNFIWTQPRHNEFIESLKTKKKPLELNNTNNNTGNLDNSMVTTTNDTTSQNSVTDLTDSDSDTSALKLSPEKHKRNRSIKGNVNEKQADSSDPYNKLCTKVEYNDFQQFINNSRKKVLAADEAEELVKSSKKSQNLAVIADPAKIKICNRMECNYHLSNKKALFYNMRAYYEAIKENPFDYLPLTFHIQNGTEDKEYAKFLEYYNLREKEMLEIEKQFNEADANEKKSLQNKRIKNIWIIKPGENTNRGHGIQVASELAEIQRIVNSNEKHLNGKQKTYIVQQYIDRPLLYNRRKFDIRCYMMITSINGYMKGTHNIFL